MPVAGYRFVGAAEQYLREHQSQLALDAARVLAVALEAHPEPATPAAVEDSGPPLHVQALAEAAQVDGYADDWGDLAADGGAAPPVLQAARHGDTVYLLAGAPQGTGLRLLIEDRPFFRRAWWLDAAAPGAQPLLEVPPSEAALGPGHPDPRLRGAVRRTPRGNRFELALPRGLLGDGLALELVAPGTPAAFTPKLRARLPEHGFYRLLLPPPGLDRLLADLAPASGARVRVTDDAGRVLAEVGHPGPGGPQAGVTGLLDRLLPAEDDALLGRAPSTRALEGPELASALAGTPASRLRRDAAQGPLIVSAAWPLHRDGRITGALVLEQSASPIQALGRQALLELFTATAAAFLLGSAALLAVAGRAAGRLRRLRDLAAGAVDESGRVKGAFRAPAGSDEIADLGRSFEAAVTRLRDYQEYLELLATRLSHEIRTPLAVVRSSLDAMPPHDGDDSYLRRARAGVDRLDGLVRRMSEAARLEQALADTEREPLDLRALARAIAAAHGASWRAPALRADIGPDAVWVRGSADLLLQAADKLLANARDFAGPQDEIVIGLEVTPAVARLFVHNTGPPLPPGDPARLFESMVSERGGVVRERGAEPPEPHLGLGLYVVRLVAEFHGGRPFAENLPQQRGVRVGIELPRAGDGR